MKTLFPSIKPYNHQMLDTDNGHKIYVEECGDVDGLPVLVVHGGPGSGCSQDDRRFFDPERYRIILFDQRGCGRSIPRSNIDNNTTADLIQDIELIRKKLGVERWMLFGGSWGSTLSLLYAQAYPDKVMGLILRGIFLCRNQDLEWFYQQGASNVFPDHWDNFISPIPKNEQNDLISAYYSRLTGENDLVRMNAAKHWSQWEASCATLKPSKSVFSRFTNPQTALSLALIETHYFKNKSFIEENQILDQMDKIENIPGIIVHGRYDMVCSLNNATELHKRWDKSELHIIRDAGHSSSEPGITSSLVNATTIMARYHE